MAITMDMFQVLQFPAPKGSIPTGSGENGTVTFWGQDDKQVKMQAGAFEPLLLRSAVQ